MVAMGYATAAMIVAGLLLMAFANGGRVTQTFFQLSAWRQAFPEMIEGFWTNIWVALVAQVIVLAFGLLLAIMRMLPGRAGAPLRLIALVYCDIFRAIPAIVVILLIVFGAATRVPLGRRLEPAVFGIIALSLTYSAYVAEVYRAGLSSIHPSQSAAARSLGLSYSQTLRTVLVPQAVRRVIPPLLNDFISLQKDTALLFAAGVLEVVATAQLWEAKLFTLAPVTLVAIFFIIITIPQARFVDCLDRSRRRDDGGHADGLPRDPTTSTRPTATSRCSRASRSNVERHEVVCLIGASGSGKSTLLRCVNALEEINAGDIRIDGDTVSGAGVDLNVLRRDVGIVFQSYNLFPHMSVLENITLAPIRIEKLPEEGGPRAGDGAARAPSAWRRRRRRIPDSLSGGQQQRVAIVRALAMQPRVMLLDEITAALDPELVGDVLEIVRELAKGGLTMLLATHEMGFAARGRQPGVLPRQRVDPRARQRQGHLREPA